MNIYSNGIENLEPLISVFIATYNQQNYIEECLNSVLNQSYKNIEIVIADDASTDDTKKILIDYYEKYPDKIKLILSEVNVGVTKNCNKGLAQCTGEYVALFAGDDYMYEGKLEKQLHYMMHNSRCAIVYHDLRVFDSKSNETLYFFKSKHGVVTGGQSELIRKGAICGGSSLFMRRSAMPTNGFDTRLRTASDWLLWIETLSNGFTIEYIDEVLGAYRRHSSNVTAYSTSLTQNDLDHLFSIAILMQSYPDNLSAINYRHARNLVGLRKKMPYATTLFLSLKISINIKAFVGLAVKIITFGKVEL